MLERDVRRRGCRVGQEVDQRPGNVMAVGFPVRTERTFDVLGIVFHSVMVRLAG